MPDMDFFEFRGYKIILHILIVITFILSLGFGLNLNAVEETEMVYLRSITYQQDITDTDNFALGYGTIKGKDYYACHYIKNDGGLELLQLPSDKTEIYEILAENDIPYAIIKRNIWGKIREVRIYVPENTVRINCELE